MPRTCDHYRHLGARLTALSAKFLNGDIASEQANPAGFDPDLDNLAAFRLLFHAELEMFLEEKAREGLRSLELDIASGRWHRINANCLSLYLIIKNYFPDKDEISDSDLKTHFSQVMLSARSRINDNNGIKASSFVLLSVASGKALDEIDLTLSAMLNSYGKDRGEVAHSSVTRSRSLMAPSAEKHNANTIFAAIGNYLDVCM